MKIFVVKADFGDYENAVAVFSTEAKAKEFVEKRNKINSSYDYDEYTVDEKAL